MHLLETVIALKLQLWLLWESLHCFKKWISCFCAAISPVSQELCTHFTFLETTITYHVYISQPRSLVSLPVCDIVMVCEKCKGYIKALKLKKGYLTNGAIVHNCGY